MLPARFWLITIPALFMVAIIESVGILRPVTNLSSVLNPPITKLTFQVSETVFLPWKLVKSANTSYLLVQNLEQQISELHAQTAELQQLRQENTYLRQAVATASVKPPAEVKRWVAPVVRYLPPLIAVPDGVALREGAAVVTGGVVIGRVTIIEQTVANISLLRDESSQPVVAQVQNSNIAGVVRYQRQQMLFTDFPPDSSIPIGSLVVSSQQVGIPGGLAIGKVTEVKVDEVRQEPVAIVQPLANFFDVPFVEIWQ